MTDQSEKITALEQRITEITEQESELHKLCGVMREENWALTAKVKDLEAQIEAVGAGGVQAMKPSDFSIAQLRHLYANMVNGGVKDSADVKRIAEGLLAPVIEKLERLLHGDNEPIKVEATPVAYMYHDAEDAHSANPMLHSTMLVFACDRRPSYANETPLYTLPNSAPMQEAEANSIKVVNHETNNELIRLAEAYARVSVLAAETNGEAVHDAKQSLVDALEAQAKQIEALQAANIEDVATYTEIIDGLANQIKELQADAERLQNEAFRMQAIDVAGKKRGAA